MRSAIPAAVVLSAILFLQGEALSGTGTYPEIVMQRESASGLVFDYHMPPVSTLLAADGMVTLTLPGHHTADRQGYPSVPARKFTIAIPPGAEVSVELSDLVVEETGAFNIAPCPEMGVDGAEPRYRWDDETRSGYYPEALFTLSRPAGLRDQRVVSLTLNPVRYDRVSGKTSLLKKVTVHLSFSGYDSSLFTTPRAAEDDPFSALYQAAVLNYQSGRSWRKAPLSHVKRGVTGDSFGSSSDWMRLGITGRGMYAVSYDDLAASGIVNPRTAIGDPRSIRIYWGGGQVLPESLHVDRPVWMEQISIRVSGEEDGSFDPGDRIEFFALGSKGWIGEFLPDAPDYWERYEHRYAQEGVYWLTWGGTFEEGVAPRLAGVAAGASAAVEGALARTTFPDRAHYEVNILQDLTRPLSDGFFWDRFESSTTEKGYRNLITSDADISQPSRLVVDLYHYADKNGLCGDERGFFWVNDVPADSIAWNSCVRVGAYIQSARHDVSGMFVKDGSNLVRIRPKPPSKVTIDGTMTTYRSKYYLNWIELGYQRFGRVPGDEPLHVRLDDSGDFRLALSGLSNRSVRVFEVSDPWSPSELTGMAVTGDSLVLHLSTGNPTTYEVIPSDLWKTPASLEKVNVTDLRTPLAGAEYLMIVCDTFQQAAAPLASHRGEKYNVKVVRISDIYHSFSWGQKDVSAVRDFLSWAYHNWPSGSEGEGRLGYALLVGDATSDWKGRVDTPLHDLIPSWFYVDPGGSESFMYPTDDYFTYLDPTEGDPDWAPDIAIGRLPANSTKEVRVLVDKIIEYETEPELGAWRNRVLVLADDERKGLEGDCGFGTSHVGDAERLAVRISHVFDREKLYLTEYPLNFAGEKPLAQSAYLEWMKKGFLISSYTGHGGFAKMADENLFNESVANCDRLRNGKRLGLFTAWSCSIGSFDLLELNSLAEILFKLEGCGSIGSYSSGAPAFPVPSTRLLRSFFDALFPAPNGTVPVGVAGMIAKSVTGDRRNSDKLNDEKYNLMGDPALMLGVPSLEVRFDNQENLEFQRSDSTSIAGSVMENDSTVATWFNGECHVTIRGMADTSGYRYTETICSAGMGREKHESYTLNGPTFFRGVVDVQNGRFEQSFFVPLDTRLGGLGRVSAYVMSVSDKLDGSGGYDSVSVVAEPPGTVLSDTKPPSMKIEVDGAPIRNGTSFTRESIFQISLEDQSGINLQQNDDYFTINLVFDGGRPIDLTGLFAYDRNSFQKGSLSFKLNDLSEISILEGDHELAFRAADNLNQRVEVMVPVVLVTEGSSLAFRQDVLNYPNPFNPDEESTAFYVDLTRGGLVTLEVFTQTGKRIWVQRDCQVSGSTIIQDCLWNGRDADGDIVGNGTYLVRATAVSDDGSESAESIGKVVVLRGVE